MTALIDVVSLSSFHLFPFDSDQTVSFMMFVNSRYCLQTAFLGRKKDMFLDNLYRSGDGLSYKNDGDAGRKF